MSVRYNDDFKKQVVRAYISSGRSSADIAAEYNIAKSSVSQWVKQYHDECQYTTSEEIESAAEIRKLNQKIKEQEKEIEFLKKAAAFFAKEID